MRPLQPPVTWQHGPCVVPPLGGGGAAGAVASLCWFCSLLQSGRCSWPLGRTFPTRTRPSSRSKTVLSMQVGPNPSEGPSSARGWLLVTSSSQLSQPRLRGDESSFPLCPPCISRKELPLCLPLTSCRNLAASETLCLVGMSLLLRTVCCAHPGISLGAEKLNWIMQP